MRPSHCSWDAALGLATEKFADTIQRHGPNAVGFYVSGQLLTEDYYVFNKLAKGLIGTNNIDSNSRLCMSSAVAGYKATLGADAPPACYDDVNHAQCLFIVGSNAAWAHPILFRRIEDARAANPGMKVIVADPRRTDTAGMADLFLPIQPGSDVMLFHGMLHLMLWEGWTDAEYIAAHTTGFDELKALVREATPERVAQVCGISVADLTTAARWFAGLDGQEVAQEPAAPRSAQTHAEPVLPGPQPEQQRHGQERRAHQPASGHRADRQARRGPLQPDRPAQRHGRARGGWHGQSAQRPPRSGQPAAPRRSGRAVGGGRCAQPSPARRRSRCSRPPPTAKSRPCGLPAPTPRRACPTRPPCAARCSGPSLWWCKRPLPPPKPAHMPTCCCPPRPGAKKPAP
jgi:hypothetical protein